MKGQVKNGTIFILIILLIEVYEIHSLIFNIKAGFDKCYNEEFTKNSEVEVRYFSEESIYSYFTFSVSLFQF